MKRLLLILLASIAYAKLELVAITHKNCPVCKRWHDEVVASYAKKARAYSYPELKVYDISEPEGYEFVLTKLGFISAIPVFVVIDEDVISKFEGYVDYKTFYEDLDAALKEA